MGRTYGVLIEPLPACSTTGKVSATGGRSFTQSTRRHPPSTGDTGPSNSERMVSDRSVCIPRIVTRSRTRSPSAMTADEACEVTRYGRIASTGTTLERPVGSPGGR